MVKGIVNTSKINLYFNALNVSLLIMIHGFKRFQIILNVLEINNNLLIVVVVATYFENLNEYYVCVWFIILKEKF